MFKRCMTLALLFAGGCGPAPSSLMSTEEEPAGANCTHGGTRLEYGVDADGNGALDAEEVDGKAYVCDGAPGASGAPGDDSLVNVVAEPPGENCPWGGDAVHYGVDSDGDGALAEGEVDGTAYVCDPRPCDGWLFDAGGGMGCWYNAPATGMSCNQLCADHGGFDVVASTHTGNPVGMHFWSTKANGGTWMTVEVSSTDNNTNWGANGDPPDGDFSQSHSLVNCACVR
jgi:hypothetical protein